MENGSMEKLMERVSSLTKMAHSMTVTGSMIFSTARAKRSGTRAKLSTKVTSFRARKPEKEDLSLRDPITRETL